jgi:hypothetical protein
MSFESIKESTDLDEELQEIKRYIKSGWPLSHVQPYYAVRNELSLVDNCVVKGRRVVIPRAITGKILDLLHQSHAGITRTKLPARSYVWWPDINNDDIESLIKGCVSCQSMANDSGCKEFIRN